MKSAYTLCYVGKRDGTDYCSQVLRQCELKSLGIQCQVVGLGAKTALERIIPQLTTRLQLTNQTTTSLATDLFCSETRLQFTISPLPPVYLRDGLFYFRVPQELHLHQ